MHTEAHYNALNGLAVKAKEQIKGLKHTQTKLITERLRPFTEQAKLLNFSHTDVLVQIGRLNGQLVDRRCD